MKNKWLGIGLLLSFIIMGCTSRYNQRSYSERDDSDQGIREQVSYFSESSRERQYKKQKAKSRSNSKSLSFSGESSKMGWQDSPSAVFVMDEEEEQKPEETFTKKEVHYNGLIGSRQAEPAAYMDSVSKNIKALGGQIEYRNKSSLILRVPVDHFLNTYEDLMEVGEITYHNLWAENLSHKLSETALRERLARATLEKLKDLLSRAETEKEKLRLLKELQRVNKELQNLTLRMSTLNELAKFSKLELRVQPLSVVVDRGNSSLGAFQWVRKLNPHYKSRVRGDEYELEDEPKGFVKLEIRNNNVYTAADGSEFWVIEKENNPKGDNKYWESVISKNLELQFKNTSRIQIKGKTLFRLESRYNDPYIYYVGLWVNPDDDKEVRLVQMFFPNKKAESENVKELKIASEAL